MKGTKRIHDPQWLFMMTGQRMGMCTNCSQWWLAPRKFRFKQIMQANCLRAPPSRRQWTCLPPPLVNVFSNSCVINRAQGEPGTCVKKMLHMLHVKIVIFPHQIPGLASEMVNFYRLAGENSCYICEKMFHMLHMLQTMLHDLHVIFPYQIQSLDWPVKWWVCWISMDWPVKIFVTFVTFLLHMLHMWKDLKECYICYMSYFHIKSLDWLVRWWISMDWPVRIRWKYMLHLWMLHLWKMLHVISCHFYISNPWTGQWISMDWPVMWLW